MVISAISRLVQVPGNGSAGPSTSPCRPQVPESSGATAADGAGAVPFSALSEVKAPASTGRLGNAVLSCEQWDFPIWVFS